MQTELLHDVTPGSSITVASYDPGEYTTDIANACVHFISILKDGSVAHTLECAVMAPDTTTSDRTVAVTVNGVRILLTEAAVHRIAAILFAPQTSSDKQQALIAQKAKTKSDHDTITQIINETFTFQHPHQVLVSKVAGRLTVVLQLHADDRRGCTDTRMREAESLICTALNIAPVIVKLDKRNQQPLTF
jgi:gas vesicle protein